MELRANLPSVRLAIGRTELRCRLSGVQKEVISARGAFQTTPTPSSEESLPKLCGHVITSK
jgi:hypothetical protein